MTKEFSSWILDFFNYVPFLDPIVQEEEARNERQAAISGHNSPVNAAGEFFSQTKKRSVFDE